MFIQLNSELKPSSHIHTRSDSLDDVQHKMLYKIRNEFEIAKDKIEIVKSLQQHDMYSEFGMVHNISAAYSNHYGVVVNPHDLWYIVVSQINELITKDPQQYKHLFTSSDKKQLILIEQDHPTDINVHKLIEQLKLVIPGGNWFVDLFLLKFTTSNISNELAIASAFVSCCKQYYQYGMFMCGIPKIQLGGTHDDWQLIVDVIQLLSKEFQDTVIQKYLLSISNIFTEILCSFYDADNNVEFWKNIYTHKNVGSGMDLQVDGWIKQLFFKCESSLLKSFHKTTSMFPYINVTTNEKFIMAHGVFGGNVVDECIESQYDYITCKISD